MQVPGHRGDNGRGRKRVQTRSRARGLSGAPLDTVSSKTKGAEARRVRTNCTAWGLSHELTPELGCVLRSGYSLIENSGT